MKPRVLVIGAGPVGLVTASLLVDDGVEVTLVELEKCLPHDQRASTFHPPTLDMLDKFGVVPSMIEQGLICPTWQFRDRRGGIVATFDIGRLAGETAHPYRLQCEQWRLGEMLLARLQQSDLAEVRFGSMAKAIRQHADGVEVEVTDEDGQPEILRAEYCIGADGLGSVVRAEMGVEFEGFTIPELYLTLSTPYDFSEVMPDISNAAYISDPDEWFTLIRTKALWRVSCPIDASLPDHEVTSPVRAEAILQGLVRRDEPYDVRHRTAYRVQERVASRYVNGRLIIAGDAAHVNNPLGGMGLNGGIHDAFNLAPRLIAVLRGGDTAQLGRYERQRKKVAIDVVQQTALRNRAILNAKDPVARVGQLDELRRTADDPVSHKAFLMRTSLIESLRDVASID